MTNTLYQELTTFITTFGSPIHLVINSTTSGITKEEVNMPCKLFIIQMEALNTLRSIQTDLVIALPSTTLFTNLMDGSTMCLKQGVQPTQAVKNLLKRAGIAGV
jgi:hypothetical protein